MSFLAKPQIERVTGLLALVVFLFGYASEIRCQSSDESEPLAEWWDVFLVNGNQKFTFYQKYFLESRGDELLIFVPQVKVGSGIWKKTSRFRLVGTLNRDQHLVEGDLVVGRRRVSVTYTYKLRLSAELQEMSGTVDSEFGLVAVRWVRSGATTMERPQSLADEDFPGNDISLTGMIREQTIRPLTGFPPPLPDPELGAIAVTIRGHSESGQFLSGRKMFAKQVYFVRLDEGADMFSSDNVIPSNFSRKKQVYLLNCQPGRYVVIGANLHTWNQFRFSYTCKVFFGMDSISQTEMTVMAGEMAFIGDLIVDFDMEMGDADKAQSYYFRQEDPRAAWIGYTRRGIWEFDLVSRGVLVSAKRTPEAEASFWTVAGEEIFKEFPAWAPKVRGPVNR